MTGLACAALVGCSTSLVLDNSRLQQEVESGLLDNGITATVTCPDNQPIEKGATFECHAITDDGVTVTILITQTDSSGNIDWQLVGS